MLRRRARSLVASAALILGAGASIAHADSIVYLQGGNVWIAHADGSGARQFTGTANNWKSPSEADDGTVVVVGGAQRINPDGSDSSGASELYRFAGDGTQLGAPIPTYGSYSTPSCPTYGPLTARVAPDASKIAYGIFTCGDASYTALWTPATATGLDFPNQTLGQQDYDDPNWIDGSRFVVSHVGPTVTDTQPRWFVHDVSMGDYGNVGAWNEPSMMGTGAQAVISRDGTEMAVFEDDSADYFDGVPRHLTLWLYTSPDAGLPAGGHPWTQRCQVPLAAASTSQPLYLSPSFSPDRSKLVWGDDRGVEVAPVTPGNCAGIVPALVIPGGAQPFYSRGDEQAAAAAPQQGGGGGGGSTGSGGGGTTSTTTTSTTTSTSSGAAQPKAAFRLAPAHPRARHRVRFDAGASAEQGGAIVAYAWSFGDHGKAKGRKVSHAFKKPGRYEVKLTVTDAAGRTAAVTRRVRVGR